MLSDRWKMRPDVLIVVLLTTATLVAYWNVHTFPFINLDDAVYVSDNIHVRAGLNLQNVIWAFTTVELGEWLPLTWLSLMLDYLLYRLNAGGYHWTNLILHIASTLLLFLSLKRMTNARWPSAFVAALFALHPLHVESVAWITERKDVLSAFFWMLTMLAYAVYAEKPDIKRYLLLCLSFILGLMSKPMIVTLPCVLLLLDLWPLYRWKAIPVKGDKIKNPPRNPHFLIMEKIPLLFLSALVGVITLRAHHHIGAIFQFAIETRIANAAISYVRYLGNAIFPYKMAVFYPHPGGWPLWETVTAFILLFAISYVCLRIIRQYPYLTVGWLWFLGTLVPVIGIVQAGSQAMADRFTYIPLIGLFIIIAWSIHEALMDHPYRKMILIFLTITILSSLGCVTYRQVQYWQNSISLFKHTIDATSDNFLANGCLGLTYLDIGDLVNADYYLKEAIRINPQHPDAHQNLGYIDYRMKKWDAAAAHFRESLKWGGHFINTAKCHNYLGVSLLMKGDIDEAIDEFKNAIEINPDLARAKINLKNAYILKERRIKVN